MSRKKDTHIELESISKSFGSIQALNDVSLDIKRNEILGLVGDNGAGKSTLIKTLSGVHGSTSGQIYVNGEPVRLNSHEDAQAVGVETVYQELAISPNRSVAANVFLGKEPIRQSPFGRALQIVNRKKMREESQKLLDRLDIDIPVMSNAGNLSGGEQQAVAVARALESDPEVMIMDEPTSALSVKAAERILQLIQTLKEESVTVILTSHNIDQILNLVDRVAVLANGELMGIEHADRLTKSQVVEMMMGVERSEISTETPA